MKSHKITPAYPLQESFALIDIKTSGLRPNKDRITEIDVVVIQKGSIQTKWHSAISAKQNTTASSKNRSNPIFADLAAKLHSLLKDNIIVAHQVEFVYAFLKAELSRSNIILHEKILCSISLSRFLFPESKVHDLNAINSRLVDGNEDEKRITLLLTFMSNLERLITPDALQNKLKELVYYPENPFNLDHKGVIPNCPGIFRCYNQNNTIIYIGKSLCLSQSLSSLLQLSQNFQRELQIYKQIKRIDWTQTYGELGVDLLAAKLIKEHKPIFNRLVEKNSELFTIQKSYNGHYLTLQVVRLSSLTALEFTHTYGMFKTENDASNLLKFFISESNLCYKVNVQEKIKNKHSCFRFKINKCKGACKELESPDDYNARVDRVLKTFTQNTWPFKKPIAIKEICKKTGRFNYHVITNWIYLNTINSLEDATHDNTENVHVDVGIHKYVSNYLNNKNKRESIIELG